jgi:hypothetical protein
MTNFFCDFCDESGDCTFKHYITNRTVIDCKIYNDLKDLPFETEEGKEFEELFKYFMSEVIDENLIQYEERRIYYDKIKRKNLEWNRLH